MPAQTAPRRRSYPSRRRKATMIPTTRAASTPSRSVTISASNTGIASCGLKSGLLRSRALPALIAEAADLEAVARRHETVRPADFRLKGHDARAHELNHP